MKRIYGSYNIALLAFIVAACAAGTQSGEGPSRSSRSAISQDELQELPAEYTAYEAVRRLRPRWLRARGPASFSGAAPVVVYMDNVRVGLIDFLTTIPLERVGTIRYFDAADATNRWGTGVAGGVIEVLSVGRRPAAP